MSAKEFYSKLMTDKEFQEEFLYGFIVSGEEINHLTMKDHLNGMCEKQTIWRIIKMIDANNEWSILNYKMEVLRQEKQKEEKLKHNFTLSFKNLWKMLKKSGKN